MNFLFLMLLTAQVVVDPYRFAASDGPSYLISQNFEGAGYDNSETWTESGAANEDYTGTVLAGSQSLRINTSASIITTRSTFSANSPVELYFLFRPASAIPGATTRIVRIEGDGAVPECADISINSTGTLWVRHGNAGSASSVSAMSADTTYHVWIRFTKHNGATGTVTGAFSTDGIRPLSGNQFVTHSGSALTGNATLVRLGVAVAGTADFIYDKVRVDDDTIGDNPL
jgi:hypothetical protein